MNSYSQQVDKYEQSLILLLFCFSLLIFFACYLNVYCLGGDFMHTFVCLHRVNVHTAIFNNRRRRKRLIKLMINNKTRMNPNIPPMGCCLSSLSACRLLFHVPHEYLRFIAKQKPLSHALSRSLFNRLFNTPLLRVKCLTANEWGKIVQHIFQSKIIRNPYKNINKFV